MDTERKRGRKKLRNYNRISVMISLVALIISLLSLLLNFITWKSSITPSISVNGHLSYVQKSYECFNFNPDKYRKSNSSNEAYNEEYGRFIMSGVLSISNNTSQGCIISDELISYEHDEYSFPGPDELIYVNGNPFNGLQLDGNESISVECEIYIYLDKSSHEYLIERFGDTLEEQDVDTIIDCLHYDYSKDYYYSAPMEAYPILPDYYTNYNLPKHGLSILISTNTGASDILNIDYKNIVWYTFLDNKL